MNTQQSYEKNQLSTFIEDQFGEKCDHFESDVNLNRYFSYLSEIIHSKIDIMQLNDISTLAKLRICRKFNMQRKGLIEDARRDISRLTDSVPDTHDGCNTVFVNAVAPRLLHEIAENIFSTGVKLLKLGREDEARKEVVHIENALSQANGTIVLEGVRMTDMLMSLNLLGKQYLLEGNFLGAIDLFPREYDLFLKDYPGSLFIPSALELAIGLSENQGFDGEEVDKMKMALKKAYSLSSNDIKKMLDRMD